MLPEYSRAKELSPAMSANIKSLVTLTRVTEVAPAVTTSAVACFGLQSFSRGEAEGLQAEALAIIEPIRTSGYSLTETELFNTLDTIKKTSMAKPGILPHCMEEILKK